jgi:hypothetical protein
MKKTVFNIGVLLFFATSVYGQSVAGTVSKVWVADNGDGTYKNPLIDADYSDPDAIRAGEDRITMAMASDSAKYMGFCYNVRIITYVFG